MLTQQHLPQATRSEIDKTWGRSTLFSTSRALSNLPAEIEKVVEVNVGPLSGADSPGPLETTGKGVVLTSTCLVLEGLAQTRIGVAGALQGAWSRPIRAGTMHLAESVATTNQCNRLTIVETHVAENVANVLGAGSWVGWSINWATWVDVDETDSGLTKRVLALAFFRARGDGLLLGAWAEGQ